MTNANNTGRTEHAQERKHLLVVSHRPSEKTVQLTEAVVRGACSDEIDGVTVRVAEPLQCGAEEVLWSHAIVLGSTENFGYMSGAMKDFFDRIYYPCLEHTEGKPYALFIRAGKDGTGARTSIERIVTGLRWQQVQAPVIAVGEFKPEYESQCEELGMTIAAGLAAGIY